MNYLSRYFCYSYLWQVLQKFIRRGESGFKKSSATEMKISKKSAPLRSPSLCLRLSCLALAIAAWLGLSSPEQQKALLEESLFSKGWQPTDGISCPQLEAGKFYQLENELESRELFVSESGSLFISNLPNIEAPFNCHEIKTASHIKEI